jgi:hypothetical protein
LRPCEAGFRCNDAGQCEDLSTVGDSCINDNDCEGAGADCIGDAEGWDGGYCTQDCNPNAQDCPEGDVCSGAGLCFRSCENTDDCRDDYVCGGGNFPQACIPTCTNNLFCGNGNYCDVDGSCDNSRGNAVDWTRCTDDECGGLCLTEADLTDAPAGFTDVCTHICTDDDPCANGFKCVSFGAEDDPDAIHLCLKNCTQDSNCTLAAGDTVCVDSDGNATADACWFL